MAALSRRAWAEALVACALARRGMQGIAPYFFTSANGNVLSRYARAPEFRAMIDSADAVDADGQPLVIASKLMTNTPIPERAATTDVYHDVASAAAAKGLSFYLLGGTEEINRIAAERTLAANPGLVIAGRRNGYFRPEEEAAIAAEINSARPDVVWVGLGVPREHAFVVRNRARLTGVGVIKTCGGLFDFVAGKNSRAPYWMQLCSLEWLYRLSLEPRRLFWRYATTNVHSVYLLLAHTSDRS